MFVLILPTSSIRNMWRAVRRIYMLKLGLNGSGDQNFVSCVWFQCSPWDWEVVFKENTVSNSYFVVPENVHTHSKEGLGKFGGRGWGISKANITEGRGGLGSISTSHSGSGFLFLSMGSFAEQQLVIEPREGLKKTYRLWGSVDIFMQEQYILLFE